MRGLESLDKFPQLLTKTPGLIELSIFEEVMPSVYQQLTLDSSDTESCLCPKSRTVSLLSRMDFAEWESFIMFITSRSSTGEPFVVPGVTTLQKVSLYSRDTFDIQV